MNNLLSTLGWEPNLDESARHSHIGSDGEYAFWRVFIDGEALSEKAQPFTSTDRILELSGAVDQPYWGDGDGYVAVRRIGDYIIWFADPDYRLYGSKQGLPAGKVLAFDAEHYAQVVGIFKKHPAFTGRSIARSLPSLSSGELAALLKPSFPNLDMPIYRVPEREDDMRGVALGRRVEQHIINGPAWRFSVTTQPESWMEIRVGLDMEGLPEAIWQIGKVERDTAVMFVERPSFPLWLCGEAVDLAFGSEFD